MGTACEKFGEQVTKCIILHLQGSSYHLSHAQMIAVFLFWQEIEGKQIRVATRLVLTFMCLQMSVECFLTVSAQYTSLVSCLRFPHLLTVGINRVLFDEVVLRSK